MTARRRICFFLPGWLWIAIGCALAPVASSQTPSGTQTVMRAGEPVTLNFVGAEIEAVARAMATITGRQLIVDPRVKGLITLATERAVSPTVAFNQFVSAIRLLGFAVVETGGLYKVVPEAEAKLQATAVTLDTVAGPSNQVLTQIFRLNFESAANMVPVLRPLISPNNTININGANNSLIVTDYAENLTRIGRIIAALDVSNSADIEVIVLRHAIAADLAPLVQRLLDAGAATEVAAQGQSALLLRTTLLPEPRSNALILRASNPARVKLARALIEKLDQPSASADGAGGNIHVVYLKNADATRLATTLRASLAGDARAVSSTAPGVGVASAASVASAPAAGQIQADAATNALIITAPAPLYQQLRAVIDLLDTRRAQVYVESLIAEVNADKAAEFGIQWQTAIGNKGDSTIGVLGSNFGAGGNNIITLATQAGTGNAVPGRGLNLGLVQNLGGASVLTVLARFLEQTGDGNILSTPNLVTLDNEEAKIVIGQNVPFVTGQFTNTGGNNNGSVNPFQTIERKDVGLTLRVRPQISENGTVKLTIYQEVSSIQASSVNSPTGLITNKRSIESTVLVEDGAIIVLGGLLQDEYSGNQEKVPGLGDLPVLGNLFRSETRSRKKTNLMVFLRPVVMRDASATQTLSQDRYDSMLNRQRAAQPVPSDALRVNEAPQLPMPAPPKK